METIHPSSALSLSEQRLLYAHELAEYSYRQLLTAQQEYSIAEATRQAQALHHSPSPFPSVEKNASSSIPSSSSSSQTSKKISYSKNGDLRATPATPVVSPPTTTPSIQPESQHRQGQRPGGGGNNNNSGGESVVGKVGRAIVRAVDYAGHGRRSSKSSNNPPNT